MTADEKLDQVHTKVTEIWTQCTHCRRQADRHERTLYHDCGIRDNGDSQGLVAVVQQNQAHVRTVRRTAVKLLVAVFAAVVASIAAFFKP